MTAAEVVALLERELKAANERHERQLKEAKDALADANARHERQLKEANERHERQLNETKSELKAANDANTELKEANIRLEEQKKANAQALADAKQELKESNDRLLADAKQELKESNDRLLDFAKFAVEKTTDAFVTSRKPLRRTRKALEESTTIAYGCRARLVVRHDLATIDFVKGPPRLIQEQVEDNIEPRILRSVNGILAISETKKVASAEAADKMAKGVVGQTKRVWREHGQQFTKKVKSKRQRVCQ